VFWLLFFFFFWLLLFNLSHAYTRCFAETGTWINPSTKGTTPPKRDYHSMVNFDEKNLVLFGGTSADAEFNDVFVFSTSMHALKKIK